MDNREMFTPRDFEPIYKITPIAGYLLGIKKEYFENEEYNNFILEDYEKYEKIPILYEVRLLSQLRTHIFKNFTVIWHEFNDEMKNLTSSQYLDDKLVQKVFSEKLIQWHQKADVYQYIDEINEAITQRIRNAKSFFPEWIKWEYVQSFFTFPFHKGFPVNHTIKEESLKFKKFRQFYPFGLYCNMCNLEYFEDIGNILRNDERLVKFIYKINNEEFTETSLVRKESEALMGRVNTFLDNAGDVQVFVDCENSNPVKFASFILSLSAEQQQKIRKINLYDGEYTNSGWITAFEHGMLGQSANYELVTRLYSHKSQVDMTLALDVQKAHYETGLDSVMLVSSDSDYLTLINNLDEVDFFVMLEKEKSGETIRSALREKGISYCFIDDFNSNISYSIKELAVKRELEKLLNPEEVNIDQLFIKAHNASWMQLTDDEKQKFYKKYINQAHIEIEDGIMRIVLGK